jgi:hypothetical protein
VYLDAVNKAIQAEVKEAVRKAWDQAKLEVEGSLPRIMASISAEVMKRIQVELSSEDHLIITVDMKEGI